MKRIVLVASLLLLAGCPSKPSASAVCAQIVAAGIGKNCKEGKPLMMSARAKTKYDFDLVSVPGKGGQVLDFGSADDFKATVDAFNQAGMLAGPHRYGSEKASIFVQMNDGASLEVGKKTKALVEAL